MNEKSTKPDFIGIGLEKTGTTWLYSILSQHHDVWLPPVKELRYWSMDTMLIPKAGIISRWRKSHWNYLNRKQYAKKVLSPSCIMKDFRQTFWNIRYLFFPYTDRNYQSLFTAGAGMTCGDITPSYFIIGDDKIKRLKRLNPNLKVILLLRNPVDRAWSKAKMNLCVNRNRRIEDVTENELNCHLNFTFQSTPSYMNIINRWQQHFGSNLFIGYYDLLQENPYEFYLQICHFLGIDADNIADAVLRRMHEKVNKGIDANIPEYWRDVLIEKYKPQVEEMDASINPYKDSWLKSYE